MCLGSFGVMTEVFDLICTKVIQITKVQLLPKTFSEHLTQCCYGQLLNRLKILKAA